MKRLLFSLFTGTALVAAAAAQDTAPREERPADSPERREDQKANRKSERPADRQDQQGDRRDDRKSDRRDNVQTERRDDRRDNPPAERRDNVQSERRDDRRDNVQTERRDDRRDNVQTERRDDRRDKVQTERRDDIKTERRDNVQTERRDNVQTERRDDRRDNVQTERRDDRRDDVQAERRDDRRLQGRVVRTDDGRFVVRTRDNREVTVYTNPRTRYLSNNRAIQYSDLRVGSNVSFGYALEGERYIADTVTLVPADAPRTEVREEVREEVRTQPAPAEGTVVQGEVVRVVGQDQVVLRTTDGKEVIVYVSPQTTYQFNNQPATFTQIRPGTPIGVNYDVRDNRFQARRIFNAPARRNNR